MIMDFEGRRKIKQYWECNNQTACKIYYTEKKKKKKKKQAQTGHNVASGVQKIETSQTIF